MNNHLSITQAINVVSSLANRTDLIADKQFRDDNPHYNQVTIHALLTVLDHINEDDDSGTPEIRAKQARNIANDKPRNSNMPWTDAHRQILVDDFNNRESVHPLMEKLGRSKDAICAELCNQGAVHRDFWKTV